MSIETQSREEQLVIGLAIRTINKNGQGAREIGALWQRFFDEGWPQKIPNRVDEQTHLGVYLEYDSDQDGPYTFIAGALVSSLQEIPQGLQGITIGAGTFAAFRARGTMPLAVAEAWQSIWNSPLKRAFTADFEVYDSRFFHPDKPEVDIYVAL